MDYIGSEQKYRVTLRADGFDMDRDDYEIIITSGKKTITLHRPDVLIDDKGNHYIAIDTTGFKRGDVYATVYAYVPDEDFPDGVRTEIAKVKLTTLNKL